MRGQLCICKLASTTQPTLPLLPNQTRIAFWFAFVFFCAKLVALIKKTEGM
jgi:hypothetical protein